MTDRKRLKIALVVDRFGHRYGGAESYGVSLMRELSARHDITVFAQQRDPGCTVELPFVRLNVSRKWPSWIRSLFFAVLAARATRQGFDIVHSHMNGWCGDVDVIHVTPVRYNWRVRHLPAVKRVLSYFSPRVQTYLLLERFRVSRRTAHRSVAVSALIQEQLRLAYGPHVRVPVVPPGVDLPDSEQPGGRKDTRQRLGFNPGDCVCLLVARNPLRKGLSTILRAMRELPPPFKLLVVGGADDTRAFIERSAAYRPLMDRIQLIEQTPRVAEYYAAADIYVHPTLNDSFGMAPLEAMSFGLPVIVSPAPWCGFAHYVTHGHDAMVMSHPEDVGELMSHIKDLRNDAGLRARLQHNGAKLIERFSWPKIAEAYERMYDEVLAERAGSSSP